MSPLLINLIGLSARLWEEYRYVEQFKNAPRLNLELVLGSPFSLKQTAELLDRILAPHLLDVEHEEVVKFHRPLQEAIRYAKSGPARL